ncbi:MAG: hypothetical protein IJ928_03175 [Prevotella sp.]|nr:hypothetical protein [Prevotella sp.]
MHFHITNKGNKCSALSSQAVNVSNITYTTDGDVKTATGTYVHNGATYTFTDTYLLPIDFLGLRDASSNEENLDTYSGRKVTTLMLLGRTLYADGSWNTLCLPFSLSNEDVYMYLNPTELKTLGSSEYNSSTGTLTLNFIDATAIEAGKPYLIKWTGGGNRTNPSFNYVTINNVNAPVDTEYVTFAGFFSPVSLDADDRTKLLLGSGNNLYYPDAQTTIGSFRACFLLNNGLTAGNEPNEINKFVLNFGDKPTGVGSISKVSGKEEAVFGWFTLDGRRLSSKPTAKGIYINNGHKVVIK